MQDKTNLDKHYADLAKYYNELYLCQSYFDDNNKLQDCTCGKCV